jgi:hypothetical protein
LNLPVQYGENVPLLKVRLSAQGRGVMDCIAKVDSGATVTVLPRALIERMGVENDDLEEMGSAATAGGRMQTWQSRVPVELSVLSDQRGTDTSVFGPVVGLHGVVGENNNVLLGQRDFFAAFDVFFDRNGSVPVFELRA